MSRRTLIEETCFPKKKPPTFTKSAVRASSICLTNEGTHLKKQKRAYEAQTSNT